MEFLSSTLHTYSYTVLCIVLVINPFGLPFTVAVVFQHI